MSDKEVFKQQIRGFFENIEKSLTDDRRDWTIKGIIDVYQRVFPIPDDTKVISKLLELHIFPHLVLFAEAYNYQIVFASKQNYYPDVSFISKRDEKVKFALDIKTTYFLEEKPNYCNGFTLGSHGAYFQDPKSNKNIQYPYGEYQGHFCLGIIYHRKDAQPNANVYSLNELSDIPSVIHDFVFFVEEKWRLAGDKSGSGNTANIGSVKYIPDLLAGNGVFSKAGEDVFYDYWVNYGKMMVKDAKTGTYKKLTSFSDYLNAKNLPSDLNQKQHE